MVELHVIAMTIAIMAFAAVLYKIYLDLKKPSIEQTVPQYRGKPLIITEAGLGTPSKKTLINKNQYRIDYEAPLQHYKPIYHTNADFDEIIDISQHQSNWGSGRPLKIEYGLLLRLAYGYEHEPTRQFMKKELSSAIKNFAYKEATIEETAIFSNTMEQLIRELNKPPLMATEIIDKSKKSLAQAQKYEHDLRKEQSSQEGRLQRRTEQYLEVVRPKAAANPFDTNN